MSIVITGNPGVGKHTIAKEIAGKLNLPTLDINTIAKNSGLLEKSEDTNDVDVKKLKRIMGQKISGENVIVGHLAPYVLDKNQVTIMIVLRRSPYDLIQVYKERKYSNKKIKENAGSEILGVIAHDATHTFQEKVFQIKVTNQNISKTVEKSMNLIHGNDNSDKVDWLGLVTDNDDLKKFFGH